MFYWTSTEWRSLYDYTLWTQTRTLLFIFLFIYLSNCLWPQTSCSQPRATRIPAHKLLGQQPEGLQSPTIMWFPRGIKHCPSPSPPQPSGHPALRRQALTRLPQENKSPKMTTFSICNLIFFFNMSVVCFPLCQKSTNLSFCHLFVLRPVWWKCIGFSVSDYTSSHAQFTTPCPKEQM